MGKSVRDEIIRILEGCTMDDIASIMKEPLAVNNVEYNLVVRSKTTRDVHDGECQSNSGHDNIGKLNTGDKNTGNSNVGSFNSGNYNAGDNNEGDYNTGDFNRGNNNTHDNNRGNYNSGMCNKGDKNSGSHNTGDKNSGYNNTGEYNSGRFNIGNGNSGDFNTGDWNSGDFNITSHENGFLNTIPAKIRIFNKETDMSPEEFRDSDVYELLMRILTRRELYIELDVPQIQLLKSIPNFDPVIFKEITGIQI